MAVSRVENTTSTRYMATTATSPTSYSWTSMPTSIPLTPSRCESYPLDSYDAYDYLGIGCRRQTSESHKKKTESETIGYVSCFHPDCEYLTKHPYDLDKHQKNYFPSYPSPTAQRINPSTIRSMTSQKREVVARHTDYYTVFSAKIKPNANTT